MRISGMNDFVRAAAVLLLATTLLGGCNQKSKVNATRMNDLMAENEELRGELAERNRALDQANQELRDKSQLVSQLRREMDGSQTAMTETGFEGIAGVSGQVGAGEVTATIESDILFQSGSANLKTPAKSALNQVASVLNSTHSDRMVRIGGHTDTDPIRKSGFKSNYHLGFERAWSVRDYLVSRGVDSSRIYIASYGPDRPMSSKSESRRVDIAVIVN